MDKDIKTIVSGFLAYLKKQGKLHLLPGVVEKLKKRAEEQEMKGEIISAIPLSPSQIRKIEVFLQTRLKQKVKMENMTDQKILGGLIIRFKDLVIDESLAGKLRELKRKVFQKKICRNICLCLWWNPDNRKDFLGTKPMFSSSSFWAG